LRMHAPSLLLGYIPSLSSWGNRKTAETTFALRPSTCLNNSRRTPSRSMGFS
jgi:hypothetical protein